MLTVVGLTMGGTIAFYTFTTYTQKFLVNSGGFGKAEATLVSAASLFFYMLMQPLVGALSDRVGLRAVLIGFGALMWRITSVAFGEPSGSRAPVKASYLPMFAHLALVFAAGVFLPPALVAWFQSVARALG